VAILFEHRKQTRWARTAGSSDERLGNLGSSAPGGAIRAAERKLGDLMVSESTSKQAQVKAMKAQTNGVSEAKLKCESVKGSG